MQHDFAISNLVPNGAEIAEQKNAKLKLPSLGNIFLLRFEVFRINYFILFRNFNYLLLF